MDNSIISVLVGSAGKEPWPSDIYSKLREPFDSNDLRTGKDGYTYPQYPAIIKRLDEVFEGCWSCVIKNQEIVGKTNPTVVVTKSLIIHHPKYMPRIIEAFGGKLLDKEGGYLKVDFDFKAAGTVALKKCALELGIGLYLVEAGSIKDQAGSITPNQKTFLESLIKEREVNEIEMIDGLSFNAASAEIERIKKLPARNSKITKENQVITPEDNTASSEKNDNSKENKVAILEEILKEIAEVIEEPDIYSEKVTDLVLHMHNKRAKKNQQAKAIEEITEKNLKELLEHIKSNEDTNN